MDRYGSKATHMLLAAATLVVASAADAAFQTREAALAALEQYSRLIDAAPRVAVFYTQRGDAYYALNDLNGAVTDYSAAIRLDDRQDQAYFGRGMALGRLGLVDEGIADLDVYIQRHPNDSVAYTKRGVRNIWRNRLADAERDLTRAIELDPNNAEAHDDLGVVHARHQRLALAARHFSTAIRLDPGYQKAYHNLALCLFLGGQNPEALQVVDAGLALDPDSRDSLLLKSTVLEALGRLDEAKRVAERAEFLPERNWSEQSEIGIPTKQGEQK
jgi:tetratricopeptide (TPR) repeat protein